MTMQREPIYAAAFAKFATLPGIVTASRKPKTWEDVPPEDTPALLMLVRREHQDRQVNMPTRWTFDVELLLYVHTGAQNDPDIVPAQVLNPILDVVGGALPVDDTVGNRCTLGGLVYSAAINGEIEIFPGNLGDEAVATIPLRIIAVEQ